MSSQPRPDGSAFGYNLDGAHDHPGLLLIHGFTASSTEMRPLADHVHERQPDWPIRAVCLGGHGGDLSALEAFVAARGAEERWLDDCLKGFEEVSACGRPVVIAGLSMGGALACRLARELEAVDVAGLVLFAPVFTLTPWEHRFVDLLAPFVSRLGKGAGKVEYYRERGLHSLEAYPLRGIQALRRNGEAAWDGLSVLAERGVEALVLAGRLDRLTPAARMEALRQRLGAQRCRLEWYERSGHLVTVEPDCAEALGSAYRFILRVTGRGGSNEDS